MMSGKVAIVAGFGDVGKGSAASLRQSGARLWLQKQIQFVLSGHGGLRGVLMDETLKKQI